MSQEPRKKCFVVSPIGDDSTPERAKQKKHANTVLKSFIKPALKGVVDEVVRADEISEPGDINQQILERLANDDLVVADLSFHNPNVFYELAIRHMLGKPYVQMIQRGERIPFDIGQKRTIMFDITDLDALEETREQIRKQAEACLAPGFKVDTPLGVAVTVESLRADDPVQRSLSFILEKLDGLAVVSSNLQRGTYLVMDNGRKYPPNSKGLVRLVHDIASQYIADRSLSDLDQAVALGRAVRGVRSILLSRPPTAPLDENELVHVIQEFVDGDLGVSSDGDES